MMAGLPVGLALAAGHLLPRSLLFDTVAAVLFFGFILFASAVLILCSPYERSGWMLLMGMASSGIVIFSRSVSFRVTTPFLLLMLLSTVFFLTRLIEPLFSAESGRTAPVVVGAVAVTVCAIVLQTPNAAGMWRNHQVFLKNEQAAEEAKRTGVLEYTDYEPYYNEGTLFADPVMTQGFLDYYGLPDVEVASTYQQAGTLRLNGSEVTVIRHAGKLYVPVRAVAEDRGGDVTYIESGYVHFWLNGSNMLCQPKLYTPQGIFDVWNDVIFYDGSTYLSLDILENVFQIKLEPDVQRPGLP